MVWVIGTSRPCGVHEGVMEVLLDIAHDPLLEISRIVDEQANARRGLLHDPFVAGPDSACNVL